MLPAILVIGWISPMLEPAPGWVSLLLLIAVFCPLCGGIAWFFASRSAERAVTRLREMVGQDPDTSRLLGWLVEQDWTLKALPEKVLS